MPYTLDEWNWIKDQLVPGCTLDWNQFTQGYTITIKEDLMGDFGERNNRHWNVRVSGQKYLDILSNAKWPDGESMYPFTERGGELITNPIERRCMLLEKKFKEKRLIKSRELTPLPLGA